MGAKGNPGKGQQERGHGGGGKGGGGRPAYGRGGRSGAGGGGRAGGRQGGGGGGYGRSGATTPCGGGYGRSGATTSVPPTTKATNRAEMQQDKASLPSGRDDFQQDTPLRDHAKVDSKVKQDEMLLILPTDAPKKKSPKKSPKSAIANDLKKVPPEEVHPFETPKKKVKQCLKKTCCLCLCSLVIVGIGVACFYFFGHHLLTLLLGTGGPEAIKNITTEKQVGAYVALGFLVSGVVGTISAVLICFGLYNCWKHIDEAAANIANRRIKFDHKYDTDGTLYPNVIYPRQDLGDGKYGGGRSAAADDVDEDDDDN